MRSLWIGVVMSPKRSATILFTRVHTIKANSFNQPFEVSVALPPSYPEEPKKRYQTIYLLDANLYFGMVTEITRGMLLDDAFPETIVVGVGYPTRGPLRRATDRVLLLRSRDLTPARDPVAEKLTSRWLKVKRVETGRAALLLSFLEARLIPFIDATYRTHPSRRVLAGHSLGGLFALYALFTKPHLFKGYVVASPSLWYSERMIFALEEGYAKRHKRLPARLFLAAAENEEYPGSQMTSNLIRFAGTLKARRYGSLSLSTLVVPNCAHSASAAPAFQAGLQAILGR